MYYCFLIKLFDIAYVLAKITPYRGENEITLDFFYQAFNIFNEGSNIQTTFFYFLWQRQRSADYNKRTNIDMAI